MDLQELFSELWSNINSFNIKEYDDKVKNLAYLCFVKGYALGHEEGYFNS